LGPYAAPVCSPSDLEDRIRPRNSKKKRPDDKRYVIIVNFHCIHILNILIDLQIKSNIFMTGKMVLCKKWCH